MEFGVVSRITDGYFKYQAWPTVAKDEKGVLYVGTSGHRLGHVCPFGKNYLYISRDDGKTWEGGLLLDGRSQVSYPDVTERDGEITVIYDRERGGFKESLAEAQGEAREILLARFTEEDILHGALLSSGGFLQRVISRLGDYEGPELFQK